MTVNCISDLSPTAKNKTLEARVYRKWIVKKPRRPTPLDYCCILIDREDTTTEQRQPTLTNYIGCLIRVGDVQTFGSAASNITVVCKLDIENLNGDVVELTLWDEMAKGFNKRKFELMAGPIIFAVSSCKVSEYNNRLQLLGTSATHSYFNPEIPELEDLQTQFVERFNLHPPLEISKTQFEDPVKEKDRNRYPLSTLLQQKPDTYRGVRFTSSITVAGINTARDWYYESCSKCPRKIEDGDKTGICPDHGPRPILAHKYNFKAFVSDQSATTTFAFFTPNADVLIGYKCLELLKKYNMPSPRDFPTEILSLKGRQHIFQFHFNPYSVTGKVDFYFDDILDKPLQITETDMPTLETRRESPGIKTGPSIPEKTGNRTSIETKTNIPTTKPSSTVTGTRAIASPPEDLAANLAATSTPASVDTSKAT
nr:hypothetical protein [Tanacetum cinerariifolium]